MEKRIAELEIQVNELKKKTANLERQLQEQPERIGDYIMNRLTEGWDKTNPKGPKVIFDSRWLKD